MAMATPTRVVEKAKQAFTRERPNFVGLLANTDVISMGPFIEFVANEPDGEPFLCHLEVLGSKYMKQGGDKPDFFTREEVGKDVPQSPDEKAKTLRKQAKDRKVRSDEMGIGKATKQQKLVCVFYVFCLM